MKLFLSWSGPLSKAIAEHFREWLPMVIQHVEPYISSSDIDKGTRWATDIAVELQESNFGLIFITPDNTEAPWIMFEAGALAKAVDSSLVAPILFGVNQSELRESPLVQFQMTEFEKAEVRKLLHTINKNDPGERLTDARLNALFEALWPELERQVEEIHANVKAAKKEAKRSPDPSNSDTIQTLEEVVVNTRSILKRLTVTEQLLSMNPAGEHAIHRLERNALDKALKQANAMVQSVANLKNEVSIELGPGGTVEKALPSILANAESVEREASEHASHVSRMRKRILQIED